MKTTKIVMTFMLLSTLMACGNRSNNSAIAATTPTQVTTPSSNTVKPAIKAPPTPQLSAKAPKNELSSVEAQIKRGQTVFRKCKACHTVQDGARHRVGPNLYGILGNPIGSKDGFAYSKAAKASGIIWSDENLDNFLKKPKVFLPGNRMTFIGLKKAEDRQAVIAYLHKATK